MFSGRSAVGTGHNALHQARERLQHSGQSYLDLTLSNPTQAQLPHPLDAIGAALSEGTQARYEPEPFGLPVAREAVARHAQGLAPGVTAQQVVLTASSSESYSFLFTLLCDPGDQVLVPAPSYPLFEYLARYSSVEPVAYRLRYDGAWHVDFDSLRRAISGRTRAVIAVSPNNPTGSYLTHEEWLRLGALGLPLICDEVFARYPLAEAQHRPHSALSVLQHPEAPVFVLDGLSKYAGLPQLKLGSIVFRAPEASTPQLIWRLQAIADTFLSVSTPVQAALPTLFELSQSVHQAIAQRIARNLQQLQARLSGSAATVLRCEGGWSAVVQLPLTGEGDDWALRLLGEQHVLVQPGWFYDFEADGFVVLSLLTPEPTFAEGISRIAAALR